MFQRLRLQLTGLCATITIAILSVFTILYLSVAEHEMKSNLALSFQNRFDTLCSSLEQQEVITYQYLLRMEQNNDCMIFLWDNDKPMSFNQQENHSDYYQLANAMYEEYCVKAVSGNLDGPLFACPLQEQQFKELPGLADETLPGPDLCLGVSYFSHGLLTSSQKMADMLNRRGTVLLVISVNDFLQERLLKQRSDFLLLSLTGCLLLTLFSYLFTGRMLKPLRENQEQQLAFISGASHELRTPLAVILSAVTAKPPRYEETIRSETIRMSRLVEELLLLSQTERHRHGFLRTAQPKTLTRFTGIQADTFLLNFYEQTESYVTTAGRHLSLSLPESASPLLTADEDKLYQLMEILLQNAVSYTKDDGHISLALRTEKSGRQLCFEVADDGIGISDADKAKIFDRFYRAENSRSAKEHFGLGLSIAKQIVDLHKGRITVSDTPGGGCTFRCFFPIGS